MKWKNINQRREYYRKWRTTHRDELRKYQRKYYQKHHPECQSYFKNYKEKYPERKRAIAIVSYAIKKGRLKKSCCIICANKKSEAHHQDYNKPLEVIWLCKSCHKKLHLGQIIIDFINEEKVENQKK